MWPTKSNVTTTSRSAFTLPHSKFLTTMPDCCLDNFRVIINWFRIWIGCLECLEFSASVVRLFSDKNFISPTWNYYYQHILTYPGILKKFSCCHFYFFLRLSKLLPKILLFKRKTVPNLRLFQCNKSSKTFFFAARLSNDIFNVVAGLVKWFW